MKLVDFRCKNCSATLQVPSDSRYVECEYCGSVLVRELSREEEFIIGGKEEAKKVADYKSNLLKLKELVTKRQNLEQKVNALKQQEDLNAFEKMPNLALIVAAVLCVLIAFSGGLGLAEIAEMVVFLLGAGFIARLVFSKTAKDKQNRNEEKQVSLKRAQLELQDLKDDILLLDGKFDRNYIPEKYRSEKALDQISYYLLSGQAMNLQNACALYDGILFQEQMLDMQKKNQEAMQRMQQQHNQEMEELKKMKRKNSDNVLDSAASIGAGIIGAATVKKVLEEFFDI